MTDLNALAIFAAVVDASSFSEAARRLSMPVSTVSRRVAELEDQLGVRLLERSTRKLRLTDTGAEILDYARHSVEISEAVDSVVSNQLTDVKGLVRISAPPSIADTILAPIVTGFQASYPAVRMQINVTGRNIDHITDGIDIAFRVDREPPDSSLITRTLLTYRHQLVASPAYLNDQGAPQEPSELHSHRLLSWTFFHPDYNWTFVNGDESRMITFQPNIAINDYSGLAAALIKGGGIGDLPPIVAPHLVESGQLVEVMLPWRFRPIDLSILHLGNRHMPRAIRLFKDFAVKMTPTLFPNLPD